MWKIYLSLFILVAFIFAGIQPKPETFQSNIYAATTQKEKEQPQNSDGSTQQYFKSIDLASGVEPIAENAAAAVSCFRIAYNTKQQPISVDYLEKGLITVHPKQQWASLKVTYNNDKKEGKSVLYAYYDNKGKRTLTDDGISAIKLIYNEKDQQVREQFLDTNDALINSKSLKFANKRILYNDANLVKEVRFFDAINLPVNNTDLNAAVLYYRYNEKGICTDTFMVDSHLLRSED